MNVFINDHFLQVSESAAEGASVAGAGAEAGLQGVPALPACRVRLAWEEDAAAAARVAALEDGPPTEAQLAARDPEGMYSPVGSRLYSARA